ncbi:MAG: hypothetical protein RLZZ440_1529 [Planctomycetota bacterium]
MRCFSQFQLMSLAMLVALVAPAGAKAAIQYSGPLNQTATVASTPQAITINGQDFQFGVIAHAGQFSYFTPMENGSGVFVDAGTPLQARNFTTSDTIGPLTSVGNMYPTNGTSNDNLLLHEYAGATTGNFPATGTGYAGFLLGGPINFQYGWARFELLQGVSTDHTLTLVDYAWEDTPNAAITVGAVPEPGPYGLLAGAVAVAGGWFRFRRR